MPDDPAAPQPTPTNYQRTTGGNHLRWQPPTPEHLQEILPAYEILSILGQGGMGAVYKGRQKSLDRIVAIKILPPEAGEDDMQFVERFKNEARTMAKMNHASIVHVYDFGETSDGQLYIVMEFIDGTDVAKMIQSQGKLPEDYALSITAHVCDALQYAHTHGIVHRDIKPANVLINMEGQVKVADFGLAKATDPSQMGLTKTNMAMGTPDFVSPEALMPGVPLDGRADLYAVGVMLYNMLTGTIPRGAFRMPSTTLQTDARFDKIIGKAMEMDRELRYQTALDLRRDLDVILTAPAAKTGVQTIPAQQVVAQQSLPQKPMGKSPSAPQQRSADAPIRQQPTTKAAPAPVQKSNAGMIYGIAAVVVVIAVTVFMFSGGGKKSSEAKPVTESKPQPAKPVPQPATPATSTPAPTAGWQPLFTDADWQSTEPGKREWVNGKLHLLKMSKRKPWPTADGAIRARIHFKEGSKNISLTARGMNTDELYKLNVSNGIGLTLGSVGPDGRSLDTLGKHVLPRPLQPGDTLLLELRLQGDRLTALVNGAVVIEARNSRYSAPGKWGILADDGWFESVEMQTSATQTSIVSTPPSTSKPSDVLTFGGHRYQLLNEQMTWDAAQTKARAMGGHLVTITTKEEASFVRDKFLPQVVGLTQNVGMRRLLLGAQKTSPNTPWEWVSGERFDLSQWVGMQSDPKGSEPHYLNWDYGAKRWDHSSARMEYFPLVEWDDDTPSRPVATASATQDGAINLITGLDPKRGTIEGNWSLQNGELLCRAGSFARLAFDHAPPPEYDFRIQFTRTGGTNAITQHVVHAGHDVMWLMGGFGNSTLAFELVGGKAGKDNVTAVKSGIENGRRYESVVKVRRDRIQVELDGKLVVDHKTDGSDLSVNDRWKFPDAKKLGVGCQNDTVFHRIELIPFVSKPTPSVPTVATPSPAAVMPAPAAPVAPPVPPVAKDPVSAKLADLETKFQAAFERDAGAAYKAQVAKLNTGYVTALDRALAEAAKAGKLDDAVALREEKERMASGKSLPPEDLDTLPEPLKKLRATWRGAEAGYAKQRNTQVAPLFDAYDKALDAFQTELTKQNKIDDALRVKAARDELAQRRSSIAPAAVEAPAPAKATLPAPAAVEASSSWRKAAEWVLGVGGEIRIRSTGGAHTTLKDAKDLPGGRFDILSITIDPRNGKNAEITDDDFTRFNGLRDIETVRMAHLTSVTGSGFAAFAASADTMKNFMVYDSPLQPQHFGFITQFKNLGLLELNLIPSLPAESLTRIQMFKELTQLRLLGQMKLDDKTLLALAGLTKLTDLSMPGVPITDEGLVALKGMKGLISLELSDVKGLTGSGLVHLAGAKEMLRLLLTHTAVDDAALAHLSGLTKLRDVGLHQTAVTDAGIRHLALCKNLRTLDIGTKGVTGATLNELSGCKDLTRLSLYDRTNSDHSAVNDAGLQAVAASFPKLEELGYVQRQVTDAGLAHLSAMKLKKLTTNTSPGLEGLRHLAKISTLESLELGRSNLTDEGLALLAGLKFLQTLSSFDAPITDEGLKLLQTMPALKSVTLSETKITQAALDALIKARPDLKVSK